MVEKIKGIILAGGKGTRLQQSPKIERIISKITNRNRYNVSEDMLVREYLSKKRSQDDIAKGIGISKWVIAQRLHEYNILVRKKTWKLNHRKYKVDEHFFDDITIENAWVLGWILSDGFVVKDEHQGVFGLKISSKDKDVLIKIKKLIGYTGKILATKTFLKETKKYYEHLILKVSSKSIVKRLEEIGISKNKTEREVFIEEIKNSEDEEIIKYFIKGVFEGDGSIIYTKNSLLFQVVGTKELLLDVQYFLVKFLKLNKTKLTHNIEDRNHWALRYRGNKQALRIFDWLYLNSRLHLNRKYEKYIKIKRMLKK